MSALRVTSSLLAGTMLCLGASAPLGAQQVSGRLLETNSDRPVPAAAIILIRNDNSQAGTTVQSGTDGNFVVVAPAAGVYRLRADLPGYRTAISPGMDLQSGDRVALVWRVVPDTQQLRPVQVTASPRLAAGRMGGFYDRMQRRTFGSFITRDQIEKRNPMWTSDLLRTVPGLVVTPRANGIGFDVRTTEGCRPEVFVDGIRYPLFFESVDDVVHPDEIEGIEVYAHAAEVPAEYVVPGSSCGAIAIWTRTGGG
jgi:hypothetical protein